jgi:hypothetical protein
MARVQCGHGDVRNDRVPVGVTEIRRTSSTEETGRSWDTTLRPDVELTVVAESVERIRQPQWAQKLWCKSRSLVRPQLAQRATGFVLARKSVRYGQHSRNGAIAKLLQTPLLSNPPRNPTVLSALSIPDCRKFAATTTLRPCRPGQCAFPLPVSSCSAARACRDLSPVRGQT